MFVGTEGGKIECWSLETDEITKVVDAHDGSTAGISQIVELKNPGILITREKNSDKRYLVTSAFDMPEFKIWTLSNDAACELLPHIMIKTSFTEGISRVLETSPEQLVCVDTNKSLKFYDFRHEQEKIDAEEKKETLAKLETACMDAFTKADSDRNGLLDFEEIRNFSSEILFNYCSTYKAMD